MDPITQSSFVYNFESVGNFGLITVALRSGDTLNNDRIESWSYC